jgi:hypothetical protein
MLFSVFILAFIASPYWILFPPAWRQAMFLIISTGSGLLWAYSSSGSFQLKTQKISWLPLLLLFAFFVFLNIRPLSSVLPWSGDEDYHFYVVLTLLDRLAASGLAVILLMLFLLFLYAGWRKSRLIIVWVVLMVGVVALIIASNDVDYRWMPRYPVFTKWLNIIPFYVTAPFFGIYQEATFRLVPFISTVILIWFCYYKLSSYSKSIAFLFGISVATMASILYYASILYLEMPAALLMTIVAFSAKDLLEKDISQIKQLPGWYALILIGFIKETAIPFLAFFLVFRFVIQIWSPRTRFKPLNEAKIAFSTLFQ